MPRGLFRTPRTVNTLSRKVLLCIFEFDRLDYNDEHAYESLMAYQNELTRCTENSHYKQLPPALKRRIQRTLEQMQKVAADYIPVTDDRAECYIQIPSGKDGLHMRGMPAGGSEDQQSRLMHMTEVIQGHHSLPVITTEVQLPEYWEQLFTLINAGDAEGAVEQFHRIPSEDILYKSLCATHTEEYLHGLINYSIQAQRTGFKRLNSDITITPATFEILMRDCATTLFNPAPIHFSFGLPGHHAFPNSGSGFCLINKTALLMKHAELTSTKPLKYVIVGTDVNRDNGLCAVLRERFSYLDICHVDVFDSRVYPQQNHDYINDEFNAFGEEAGQQIKHWRQNNLHYFAVDLSLTTRKGIIIHPAILFALHKIKEEIQSAKENNTKVALYLPTGWDSHKDETAYCGKYVDGHRMRQTEAAQCRFNDDDLIYFYQTIFQLYHENKEYIHEIYWGLEGGYEKKMYEKELGLLLQLIEQQLLPQNTHLDRMQY